jgi:hypothetical protein
MDYSIKKVVEEIDVLCLTREEYDKVNNFYKQVISHRFPRLAEHNQIYDVQRLIMSDGLSRIEVLITVDGKATFKDPGFNRPIPDDLQYKNQ